MLINNTKTLQHSNICSQNNKLFNNRKSQLRKHNVNDEATCKCNYIGPWKQNINTQ